MRIDEMALARIAAGELARNVEASTKRLALGVYDDYARLVSGAIVRRHPKPPRSKKLRRLLRRVVAEQRQKEATP